MAVIFYFLILRPQMKRQKEHQQRLPPCKGRSGGHRRGLVGKIVRLDDHYVDLELAPNVRVKAVRSTLGEVVPPGSSRQRLTVPGLIDSRIPRSCSISRAGRC
jgi:preprotein translocase subunit YajC